MNRTACGRDNPDDNAFCGGCGAKFALLCGACGRSNPPDNAFCGECGSALAAPAETAGSAAPPAPSPARSKPSTATAGTASSAPLLPSQFANGRYVVSGFLGEGSRKRVYLARDERLDREVAVAHIKTEGLDASGIERVRREAQAMAKLGDHPNVVTVYDIVDSASDGLLPISQYMSGGDLEARLDAADDRRLPIPDRAKSRQHPHPLALFDMTPLIGRGVDPRSSSYALTS